VANEDDLAYHSLTGPNYCRPYEVPVDIKELKLVIDKALLDLSYVVTPREHELQWTNIDAMLHTLHYKLESGYQLILDGQYDDAYLRNLASRIDGVLLKVSTLPNGRFLAAHIQMIRDGLHRLAHTLHEKEDGDIVYQSQASHPHCPVRQTDGQSAPQADKKFVFRTSGESTKLPSGVVRQDPTEFASFSASKIPDDGTYQSHLKALREAIANRTRSQFGADPKMIARQDPNLDSHMQEVSSLAPTSSPYARQEIVSNGMASVEEEDYEA